MNTDVKKICPDCFETGFENGICGCCGYVESKAVSKILSPLPTGCILKNRYIVGRVLGKGGFGITYKSMDIEAGIICAVKEYAPLSLACRQSETYTMNAINPEKNRSYEDGVKNFIEEAEVLHSLEGISAVVQIRDCFLENGTAYFIMEYLDGSTLNQVLRFARKKLPAEAITRIISTIGLAMHAVHDRTKILHRDISPENIYILKDETVKLIDFGSAKRLQSREKEDTYVFLKPHFAPPEQYTFRFPQGSYTDVYALASTYYYALSGTLIPSAEERQKSGTAYTPLKNMAIGISDSVSDAVDRALNLDITRRTQTMLAFVTDINPGPKVLASSQVYPFLLVLRGQKAGRKYRIKFGAIIKLGRLTECDLCFDKQNEISKVHCFVYYDKVKNCFFVKDNDSTNGTLIGEKRIAANEFIMAAAGSRISLGSSQCIVELGLDKQ